MKRKYFYLLIIFTALGFFTFNAFFANEDFANQGGNEKLIKFSHKLHAEQTDCKSCHTKTADSKSLNDRLLPDHTACATCHDVEDDKSCNTCHFDDKYEPLLQRKSELIFDHNSHVNQKNLECQNCHKGISDVDYAFQATQANPEMEDCSSCHNSFKGTASNACETCHLNTSNLIPQDHQVVNFKKSHKFLAEATNANCVMCHDNSSCQDCHISTNMLTEDNTATNFYAPYSAHNFVDGAKQQKITRVHDLNFVYTHGVELKGKESECQTCHQVESFCAECHNSEGNDFGLAGFTPASHKSPSFITLGVGSGGGEHASLAKRDIERCASCHDTQGTDPACITCHLDNDGIKGTNPKTHPRNFMSDEKGDWHDSQASVCFNCHTSTLTAGVGFCGYCHTSKTN